LKDGKWTVNGTVPPGFVRADFHVVILQSDGRIIEIGCDA
jgi:hypothetical protein